MFSVLNANPIFPGRREGIGDAFYKSLPGFADRGLSQRESWLKLWKDRVAAEPRVVQSSQQSTFPRSRGAGCACHTVGVDI